jgi:hypothetical protein
LRLRQFYGIDAQEKKKKSKPKAKKGKAVFTKVGGVSDGEETVQIQREDDEWSEEEAVVDNGDHASDDEEI